MPALPRRGSCVSGERDPFRWIGGSAKQWNVVPELPRHRTQCEPLERGEVMESGVNSSWEDTLRSRLRTGGLLVMVGLIVEIFSFFWVHQLALLVLRVVGL